MRGHHRKTPWNPSRFSMTTPIRSFFTGEGMCMKLLSKEEISTVKEFLEVPIPEYILSYSDEQIAGT